MDFGDAEDEVTLETIEEFENMVGKHQAIIASSSYWGEQSFPTANLNVIWRHGAFRWFFGRRGIDPTNKTRARSIWPQRHHRREMGRIHR